MRFEMGTKHDTQGNASPPEATLTRSAQLRRLLPGIGLVALSVTIVCFLAGSGGGSPALALSRLVVDGGATLAWAASASGLGAMLLRWLRPNRQPDHPALTIAMSFAAGTGLLSTLELLFGLLGLLSTPIAWATLAPGVLCGAWLLRGRPVGNHGGEEQIPHGLSRWTPIALAVPLGLAMFLALVPAGLLWRGEPNAYDVLAYHLQLPREWHELGRIVPLHHNIFSYFPLGMEMHYLLAMQLMAGPWAGMYTAQLMHVTFFAAASIGAYGAFRPKGQAAAMTAALLIAGCPYVLLLAPIAYNEGAVVLYGLLAMQCLFMHQESGARPMALAGLFAGFAAAAKITALPLYIAVPTAVMLLVAARESIAHPGRLLPVAAYLLSALLALSPWLIRTALWTGGNPVFPLLMNTLGRAHFTPEQVTRFNVAHAARPDQNAFAEFARQVLIAPEFAYILMPLAVIALALSLRRSPGQQLPLLLILLAHIGIWLGLTHLQGRFFVPTLPVLVMTLGLLATQKSAIRFVPLAASVVSLSVGLVVVIQRLDVLRDKDGQFQTAVIGLEYKATSPQNGLERFVLPQAVLTVPPEQTLTLVGEAKAYLYTRPMCRLKYTSVFDAAGPDCQTAWRATPSETLWIDPAELKRFAKTYRNIPPLPPAWDQPAPFLIEATPAK